MTSRVEVQLNRLLARLAPPDQERWAPLLETVDLAAGQELYASGRVPTHGYFPTTAVVSLVYVTQDGECDEVAAVGAEGVVGVSSFMGGRSTPTAAIVQRPGRALRLSAVTLRQEVDRSAAVRQVMLEYSAALTAQVAQTAVCNCHHALDQRLARRLLQGLDRQRGDDLAITHEQLAGLLGVRRESITAEVVKLQRAGLIRCSRGHILVIDRAGLERRACECYAIVRREFESAASGTPRPPTVPRPENSQGTCGNAQTLAASRPTFHLSAAPGAPALRANGMKMNVGLSLAQTPMSASGDLATYLQQMREEERAELARELHDELGSLLTGAKLEVASLKLRLGGASGEVIQQLAHLSATIDRGIAFSRRVVEGLHPSSLTNLGLVASLEILAREFRQNTGIATATDLEEVDLDQTTQLTAYRVVQESLNNTSKYAAATEVRIVMLECGSHTVLAVRDNGKGFDTGAKGSGHGLAGMHHRVHACGGHLTVSSAPALGTLVAAVLPARTDAHAAAACAPSTSLTTRSVKQEELCQPHRLSPFKRRAGRPAPRECADA